MSNNRRHMSKDELAAATKKINAMSIDERRAWIRSITGPEHRRIEGTERSELMLMFALMKPVGESNNQRFITEEYIIADKRYHVIYGMEIDPVVEEILE